MGLSHLWDKPYVGRILKGEWLLNMLVNFNKLIWTFDLVKILSKDAQTNQTIHLEQSK